MIRNAHSLITIVLSALTFVVALIFAIPLVGRLLHWLWNIALTAIWGVIGLLGILIDMLLCVFDKKLEKKLRIRVVILSKGKDAPVIDLDKTIKPINDAVNAFKAAANVKIIRSGLPRNNSGPSQNNQADKSWVQINPCLSSDADLNPRCNEKGMIDDLSLVGSSYQLTTLFRCFYGTWRRITGYGAPIVVFIVSDVKVYGGCSLGPLTDYIVVDVKGLNCIAHELGHACNLAHAKSKVNLMNPDDCNPVKRNHRTGAKYYYSESQGTLLISSNRIIM